MVIALQIDDRDGATVVRDKRVLQKGNLRFIGRESHVGDPAHGLEQDPADGEFQLLPGVHAAHHREALPVASDIGRVNVLEHRAGRASLQGQARQRSLGQPRGHKPVLQNHGHVAVVRDTQHVGINAERPRLRPTAAPQVQL